MQETHAWEYYPSTQEAAMSKKKALDDSKPAFSAHEILAASRAFPDSVAKKARGELIPGVYPIDMSIRLVGCLRVAEDTEKVPTVRIPIKPVLGMFLARSGALREANLEILRTCIADVIERQITSEEDEDPGVTDELQSKYEEVYDAMVSSFLGGLQKSPVKGAVKADVTVTDIRKEES